MKHLLHFQFDISMSLYRPVGLDVRICHFIFRPDHTVLSLTLHRSNRFNCVAVKTSFAFSNSPLATIICDAGAVMVHQNLHIPDKIHLALNTAMYSSLHIIIHTHAWVPLCDSKNVPVLSL